MKPTLDKDTNYPEEYMEMTENFVLLLKALQVEATAEWASQEEIEEFFKN